MLVWPARASLRGDQTSAAPTLLQAMLDYSPPRQKRRRVGVGWAPGRHREHPREGSRAPPSTPLRAANCQLSIGRHSLLIHGSAVAECLRAFAPTIPPLLPGSCSSSPSLVFPAANFGCCNFDLCKVINGGSAQNPRPMCSLFTSRRRSVRPLLKHTRGGHVSPVVELPGHPLARSVPSLYATRVLAS